MRIKLIMDLPVSKEHKCFKGKEYDIDYVEKGRDARYYFTNEFGTKCAAYRHECEIIKED